MARRPAGRGDRVDPELRGALVERYRRVVTAFPTEEGWRHLAAYERAVMAGEEIELGSESLFLAYFLFDDQRAGDFTFAHDRDNSRRWLLTRDDELVELAAEPE